MAVAIFDLRTSLAVGAVIFTFVLITDAIFSAIVTYIFLKPMLEVLQAAGGRAGTAASKRLERTKRWNFAGVFITVGSSTVLYVNIIAHFVLGFHRQYSLNRSMWGNPFTFGLAADAILNTLGMILLCGMFKDVSLPSRLTITSRSNKVAAAELEEQKKELGFIIDSYEYAYSEEGATSVELPPKLHDMKNTEAVSKTLMLTAMEQERTLRNDATDSRCE